MGIRVRRKRADSAPSQGTSPKTPTLARFQAEAKGEEAKESKRRTLRRIIIGAIIVAAVIVIIVKTDILHQSRIHSSPRPPHSGSDR